MKDREVRESMFQITQVITTQAHSITAQANTDVAPQENKHSSTMGIRLRDFTRMKSPMFVKSKVDEDSQYFVDDIYKILFLCEYVLLRRLNLFPISSRTWLRHGTISGRIVGL